MFENIQGFTRERIEKMCNSKTKVCVYTICKNEEKNIKKWFEHVQDADMVVLIDTGSTDNTLDIIRLFAAYNSTPFRLEFDTLILDPFSFSEARNYAFQTAYQTIMEFEEDLNEIENWVFVSIDLDEFIEPGGIDTIRESWDPFNYDTMELGVKSICFDENGERYIESQSFVHHKVHSWKFKWIRNIHEIIELEGKTEAEWRIKHTEVYYEHIQDKHKPRDYYGLLKASYEKGDRSSKTLIYLAWEAFNHNELEAMFNYAKSGLDIVYNNSSDENYLDYQYIVCFKRYLSMYYTYKEDYINAYKELKEITEIFIHGKFPRTRLIYREIARVVWHIDRMKSIMYYHQFNEIHCPEEYWVEDFKLYEDNEIAINYMELSNAYYYSGADKDFQQQAILYAEKAYELDPNNETIRSNYEFFKKYFIS